MRRWPKANGRLSYWIRQTVLSAVLRRLRPLWIPTAFLWRRLLFRTTFIAVTGSLTDVFRYYLPFGVIGRVMHAIKVRRDVERIFDYRFRRIQEVPGGAVTAEER